MGWMSAVDGEGKEPCHGCAVDGGAVDDGE
jgi:hypothetical protein